MSDDYLIGSTPVDRELPPTGLQAGVITGVYNMGRMYNNFLNEWKPVVKVKFELEAVNKHGKRHILYHEYTASMHAKSNLRKDIQSMEGRDLTEPEAAGYSLKNLLGKQVLLQISHKLKQNGQDMKYVIKNVLQSNTQVQPQMPPEIWSYTERTKDPQYHCRAPRWVWESHMKSKDYLPPATPYVEPKRTELSQQMSAAQQQTVAEVPAMYASNVDMNEAPF